VFAERLEELVVKDIPRCGIRLSSTSDLAVIPSSASCTDFLCCLPVDDEPSSDWLPSHPTAFPCLKHLHLTGLPLPSPAVFQRSIMIPPTCRLSTLTLEDFDSLSAAPLISALQIIPALSELEELRVSLAREVEMERMGDGENEGAAWRREKEEVERWCEGKGRIGKSTKLQASWRMVKVSGFW
jgi:hypothetical protein